MPPVEMTKTEHNNPSTCDNNCQSTLACSHASRTLAVRLTAHIFRGRLIVPLRRAQKPVTSPIMLSNRVSPTPRSTSRCRCFQHGPLITKPGTIEDATMVSAYILRESLERTDFLGIDFRLQHHERIVGCTGFPTDSHDIIWMEP
jgi:hypothetical protein